MRRALFYLEVLLSIWLVALLLVIIAHLLLPDWFWHPLATAVCRESYKTADSIRGCKGYNFWSGIAGSFIVSLPGWAVAGILFFRRHECHVQHCYKPAWHPHPEHGHPVCKRHHPDHGKHHRVGISKYHRLG